MLNLPTIMGCNQILKIFQPQTSQNLDELLKVPTAADMLAWLLRKQKSS